MGTQDVTSVFKMDKEQVRKAVTALHQYLEKTNDSSKPALLDEHQLIRLQLSVKKIPPGYKKINIKLPHTLQHHNTEVCLLTGDLNHKDPEYSKTVNHYKDLFRQKGIKGIAEILPLRLLRTEYKAFEAKIRLSKTYDKFLADDKLMGILPKYLGKHFIGTAKHPMQVNLRAADLKKEIETALSSTRCIINAHGDSYHVDIGHTGLSENKLIENILAACERLAATVPGTEANIQSLHISLDGKGIALPIFASFGGGDLVKFDPLSKKHFLSEAEEVTTVENGKIRVSSTGYVTFIPDRDAPSNARPDGTVRKDKPRKTEIVEADSSSNDSHESTGEGSTVQGEGHEEQGQGEEEQGQGQEESDDGSDSDASYYESEDDSEEHANEDKENELEDDSYESEDDIDSNEAISDDSDELQFESDYSDDSDETSDNEGNENKGADTESLEHIRGLWNEGSDAELDSDQVSDTTISDSEEEVSLVSSTIDAHKCKNKPVVRGSTDKSRKRKVPAAAETKKLSKQDNSKQSKKGMNKAEIIEAKKSSKESISKSGKKNVKEVEAGEMVKVLKSSKKKEAKDTVVTQGPPTKKAKLSRDKVPEKTKGAPAKSGQLDTKVIHKAAKVKTNKKQKKK